MSELTCPSCGNPMVLRRTEKFRYPKSKAPRLFYGCSTWPKCFEVIGAHPDGRPLRVPVKKGAYRNADRSRDRQGACITKTGKRR